MNIRQLLTSAATLAFAASMPVMACDPCDEEIFIHFEDLERGTDVSGMGTVHPYVNIDTIHLTGDMPMVIETGYGIKGSCDRATSKACVPYAYAAPNGIDKVPNNCLEDRAGNRVELTEPWPGTGVPTAKGFADVEMFNADTPQEFRFTFGGPTKKVKYFEILITDFGDFNKPENPHPKFIHDQVHHNYGLYAFSEPNAELIDQHGNERTDWVDMDVMFYMTPPDMNPRWSYNPDYGDLWYNGDACSVDVDGQAFPGFHKLRVKYEGGIGTVYLLEREGADPHGGFDSIRTAMVCDTDKEGCSAGYWKNHAADWVAAGYDPFDSYEIIFGVTPSFTKDLLMEVLTQGGGGERALGRQAVAALLNAAHPDVDYTYTESEVSAQVQSAYNTGEFELVKKVLDNANTAHGAELCD